MYKLLLAVLLMPTVAFGQRKKEKLFLTGDFKIKALTKKPNYIDEKARISLVRLNLEIGTIIWTLDLTVILLLLLKVF
jgi:hypothetical protein